MEFGLRTAISCHNFPLPGKTSDYPHGYKPRRPCRRSIVDFFQDLRPVLGMRLCQAEQEFRPTQCTLNADQSDISFTNCSNSSGRSHGTLARRYWEVCMLPYQRLVSDEKKFVWLWVQTRAKGGFTECVYQPSLMYQLGGRIRIAWTVAGCLISDSKLCHLKITVF